MAQDVTFPATAASGRYAGYALAAVGAVLFSVKGILIKLAYGDGAGELDVDAITLLALRMAFSLPFLAVIGAQAWRSRLRRGDRLPSWRQTLLAAFIGLLGYYFASYLDFVGLVYLSAQFERLILLTYPMFVMLLGALFFGQRVTAWGVLALCVSYVGILLIFAGGATAKGDNVALGVAFVLAAGLAYAFYQLLATDLIMRMGTCIFTSISMVAACLGVLAHFMVGHSLLALFDVPVSIVALAAAMAILSTVLPSFMLSAALERVGAQAVSMIGTVSPVATIVMATAVLGEPFALVDAVGAVLVIAGVGLFTRQDIRGKRK